MPSDYSGGIPLFLESFLSNFETAIPKAAQWVLYFEGLTNVTNTVISTIKEREHRGWDIELLAKKITTNDVIQKQKGCLFAQAVEIPSEGVVANPEGLQYNGFLRTTTGNGRDPYSNGVRIAFLETNYSFVDSVIRPWVITTGHLGFIARPDKQYRCNIVVCKLGSVAGPVYNNNTTLQQTGQLVKTEGIGPVVLQRYTFHDACPIAITGEEYNYSQGTGPVIRETTFTYNWYTVDHGLNG